jgi:hypothetical protein
MAEHSAHVIDWMPIDGRFRLREGKSNLAALGDGAKPAPLVGRPFQDYYRSNLALVHR